MNEIKNDDLQRILEVFARISKKYGLSNCAIGEKIEQSSSNMYTRQKIDKIK